MLEPHLFSLLKTVISKHFQVAVPVYGDQPANAYEAEHRGYAISIPLPELTSEKLYTAVNTILTNRSFTEKAKEHGQLVMDQMNTPLETAVWWLEYVLRHPGMKHMRSPVHDLNWPQYFLLDVIAVITFIIVSLFTIIFFLFKCCLRYCHRTSELKVKKE